MKTLITPALALALLSQHAAGSAIFPRADDIPSFIEMAPGVPGPPLANATSAEQAAYAAALSPDGGFSTQSGCDQGTCPDHNAMADLFTWNGSQWLVRMKECGECHSWLSSGDGCARVHMCPACQLAVQEIR